ncbi:MAG: MarR family transcriptional regulator [Eubacteriales bacterium]|nr:MarR family transcriptional regulator [Eubacteriales bacterium]
MRPDQTANRMVGKEIHRLSNRIKRSMDSTDAHGRIEAVTGSNGWIIRFLSEREEQAVYQKDLENEFGITRSTASKVIRLMEQKGLVTRESVAHDARLKRLRLTDKSRELSMEMHRLGDAMDHRLLMGFTQEEEAQLYRFLDRMMENLESTEQERGSK